jgi:prepilin-type processing-associated H-X9-DG protein
MNNEKQLGLALMQYVQDYDECYPMGTLVYYGTSGRGWAGQIYPYFKSVGTMICPSDPKGHPKTGWSYGYNVLLGGYGQTAGAKYTVTDGGTGSQVTAYITQSNMLIAPTKTVAIFEITESVLPGKTINHTLTPFDGDSGSSGSIGLDGNGPMFNDYQFYDTGVLRNDQNGSGGQIAPPTHHHLTSFGRHTNGSNYVMADGHVKFLLPTQVTGGYAGGVPSGISANPSNFCVSNSYWYMPAGTQCSDPTIAATFSTL